MNRFFEDINKFLKNIARIDYKYLLTTTHILDKDFVSKEYNHWRF
jgi:hypothetical protein